jgi:hypothetical protein
MIGRIVAYIKGDGYIGRLSRSDPDEILEFSTIDKDMFEFFAEFVISRFGKCGFIRTRVRKNVSFIFRTKRKDVISLLKEYAPYGTYKWRITPAMFRETQKFKKDFIAGFIEAEGYVDLYTKRITVYSSNLLGLGDFKNLLDEFKISSVIVGPYAGAYRLLICGERNLTKILDFGFSCERKKRLLKAVVESKNKILNAYNIH